MSLCVAGLWRYPVKTLAGERLPMTTLTTEGVPFDRIVQVIGWRARSRPKFLTGDGGEVTTPLGAR